MANVTSIVGRFDGTVTYTDQTWGSFHCQIETFDMTNDLIWSLAEVLSEENLQRIYGNASRKSDLVEMLETMPVQVVWTDTAKTDKIISDMVVHLYLLIAFDDGTTYPLSSTHEKGEIRFHTSSAVLGIIDNSSALNTKIKAMLEKIMNSVTVA